MRSLKRIAPVAVTLAAVVGGLWVRAQAQIGQRPLPGVRLQRKSDLMPQGARARMMRAIVSGRVDGDPPPDPFPVAIDPTLNLDPDTQALYQQMATALDGYAAVPNDRLNFYSAINNPPNSAVTCWGGFVEDVQPAAGGGYQVTVAVTASTATSDLGPRTLPAMAGPYYELYNVNGGVIQYLGFQDPRNVAGQPPVYSAGF